jgi:redox-sensitive bicupin YhaK (pirin superfamily)
MKFAVRRSQERGFADHGWLVARHSFSFADYHDPAHMGFRSLRVINQDLVDPAMGFPPHGHRDMEIFTYVLEGAIEHRDSLGNHAQLKPGQIQVMSAGSGVKHSEYNPSKTDRLHLIQVWIQPDRPNLRPRYAEWKPTAGTVSLELREGRGLWFQLIGGEVEIGGVKLSPGDALKSEDAGTFAFHHAGPVEALLFDLA